jgi:hypothetical protein
MRRSNRLVTLGLALAFAGLFAGRALAGGSLNNQTQFVPNDPSFWNDSKNWTTNFGPAYRDTLESIDELLPCTGKFALCFHSGAAPMRCTLSPDGTWADCKCTVQSDLNYTLETAILNYPVYLKTVKQCTESGCEEPDDAPVCSQLTRGRLIPGADVISTFDTDSHDAIADALAEGPSAVLQCPKGPYAACMTAPCKLNADGTTAQCKCPVFYGKYQLVGPDAVCDLGGNLVPSSSYSPGLDSDVTP